MSTGLGSLLTSLAEDAFFVVASSAKVDTEMLHATAARRRAAPSAVQTAQGMDAWEPWVMGLSIAMAPIAPPRFMPMADAVLAGLSLEHGARGVRSLFTSKPSAKEVERVRTLGSFAVRALGAVLASAGTFSPDARFVRRVVIASFGLPEADQAALDAETPEPAEHLSIQAGTDAKIAKAIVRGAFLGAMADGMDPREEEAVLAIARKIGLTSDEVNQARADAKKTIDGTKEFGDAAVEAIRYVLEGDAAEKERFAIAAARLILPPVHRRESVTAINVGGSVQLGKRHELDRPRRAAVLALAWIAALRSDPTFTGRAELAARHDRIAQDLGEDGRAPEVRGEIERFLEIELCATVPAPT